MSYDKPSNYILPLVGLGQSWCAFYITVQSTSCTMMCNLSIVFFKQRNIWKTFNTKKAIEKKPHYGTFPCLIDKVYCNARFGKLSQNLRTKNPSSL